jgi:hypothetical protein
MSSATVRPESPAEEHDPVRKSALWTALLAGPVVALASLEVLYLLVPWSCRNGSWPLHATATGAALLVLGAFLLSWRSWRNVDGGWPADGEGAADRARFLAVVGMLTSAVSFAVLLAQWIAILVLNPCLGAG